MAAKQSNVLMIGIARTPQADRQALFGSYSIWLESYLRAEVHTSQPLAEQETLALIGLGTEAFSSSALRKTIYLLRILCMTNAVLVQY